MPSTGTTLCHLKIGYVDPSVTPLSTHKLPIHRWSALMKITPTLPQIPDTKLMVTSKVQFLQLQHVFPQKCKKHNPSHVRQHTLPSQHLMTPFRLHTNKPKLHKSFSTKSKPYSMLQYKLIHKNTFRTSPSYFIIIYLSIPYNLARGLTTLSEETLQRKHTYVTTIPRYQQQKLRLQNGSPSLNNNTHFITVQKSR